MGVGRWPLTEAMERRLGTKVWITPPNPLAVYVATLSARRDGYVWRMEAAGPSEETARDHLERMLRAVAEDAR